MRCKITSSLVPTHFIFFFSKIFGYGNRFINKNFDLAYFLSFALQLDHVWWIHAKIEHSQLKIERQSKGLKIEKKNANFFLRFKIVIFLLIGGVSILTCLKCFKKSTKSGQKMISHKIRGKRKSKIVSLSGTRTLNLEHYRLVL